MIGSWACRAAGDIFAGMDAKSGELAKVHRLSTASMSGCVAPAQLARFAALYSWSSALISLTSLAVELATSFADCTNWRFATGFVVLDEASRHALHSELVCFAITVAADSTCGWVLFGLDSA